MGQKFDKFKKFVKEHKTEIFVITVGAGVGVCVGILGRKANQKQKLKLDQIKKVAEEVLKPKPIEVKPLGIGTTSWVEYNSDRNVVLWIDDINIDDLGTLGEKLREACSAIPEHHEKIQVMINAWDLKKNE